VASAFVFGHSVGGVLAPFVVRGADVAGIAVYGAPSRRWCEALCDGARRQLALRGLPSDDLDREAHLAAELYRLLLREGRSAAEALAHRPDLAGYIETRDLRGEEIFGASLGLSRALDALDLAAAWREVRAPVLAFRGEHDWIVALDDHERIWVRDGRCSAEVCVVPGIDHDMQRHANRRASLTGRGRGEATGDVATMLAAWIGRVAMNS
jgi:pimeloyl-ACP methyl ester carboxylesterase